MAVTITELAAKEIKRVLSEGGMIAAYKTVAQPARVAVTAGGEEEVESGGYSEETWVAASDLQSANGDPNAERTTLDGQPVQKVKFSYDDVVARDGGYFLSDDPEVPVNVPYLRVGIKAGGCSGFEYDFTFSEDVEASEYHIGSQHGLPVAVHKKSSLYLDGTEIGFHEGIDRRGFTFENPNAVKSCGCGSSFQA